MDNINIRVPWSAMKFIFEDYGFVMDVFFPKSDSNRKRKDSSFAFIKRRSKMRFSLGMGGKLAARLFWSKRQSMERTRE